MAGHTPWKYIGTWRSHAHKVMVVDMLYTDENAMNDDFWGAYHREWLERKRVNERIST
jgi:hypothetical protein